MPQVLKVVSLTFCVYIRSIWNQLDFLIVFVSILVRWTRPRARAPRGHARRARAPARARALTRVARARRAPQVFFAEYIPGMQHLRVLRILRVLRPLRLVSRNAGMRLIITSLFKALPAVSNVFGVVLTLQVVFAIIGMQLFSGAMSACSDPSLLTRDECVGRAPGGTAAHDGRIAGLGGGGGGGGGGDGGLRRLRGSSAHAHAEFWDGTTPRVWAPPAMGSFDDFGSAMRLLYVMSSADQYVPRPRPHPRPRAPPEPQPGPEPSLRSTARAPPRVPLQVGAAHVRDDGRDRGRRRPGA